MKLKSFLMMSVMMLGISGCVSDACTAFDIIPFPSQDARDAVFEFPELDRDIIAHNETFTRICT